MSYVTYTYFDLDQQIIAWDDMEHPHEFELEDLLLSECIWLVPEGTAPSWEEPETVQVAYWRSILRLPEYAWLAEIVSWPEDYTIWPNESLRMFP